MLWVFTQYSHKQDRVICHIMVLNATCGIADTLTYSLVTTKLDKV